MTYITSFAKKEISCACLEKSRLKDIFHETLIQKSYSNNRLTALRISQHREHQRKWMYCIRMTRFCQDH